jgi:hypothetical protein
MFRAGFNLIPNKGYHFKDGPFVEYIGKVEAKDRDGMVIALKEAFSGLVEEDIDTTICMMT